MCPQTVNKNYEVQSTGTNTGAWGTVLNEDMIEIVDRNMGGLVSKSLSSSNVTLTTEESQNAIVRLTGILTGNVQITTSCIGFVFVENLTTGAFAVTVRNSSVATAATIAQGSRQTVLSDATNGCRVLSSGFETGVKAAFYMSAAPIGWTRDATAALNNAAIQLVTTGGGTTGGTVDFTTAFASQTPAGTVGTTALTVGQLPSHSHGIKTVAIAYEGGGGAGNRIISSGTVTENTDTAGSGEGHTHSFTGTPIDLAVKRAAFLVATKD
jgi:hypothetical protein